ncbi:HAD-superfamily hydrolase, subfamily IIB [Pirellula staleyi DSM 6068]|uniref:HAD-superfamily hydrolase, subfamily IIB n=1 Tax=Pirellula staleyi (strain ATCC 27377 / DSM 6068 / ICPB 4128) TaxID=530564 RepID=D2R2K6_PIRSD|nr:HAD-IIB family hydrolase [Pirellula staleyi]ADB16846.1 HAD-superfamily hydrolase, subfamily IIB [Pirellula staleyi DSM 6068]
MSLAELPQTERSISPTNDRWLIVSDLDGTLLGDTASLEILRDWLASCRDKIDIAYASGRLEYSIRQAIDEYALPTPVATASGVGTEIHWYGASTRLPSWPQVGLGSWSATCIREILAELRSLVLQPELNQSAWKVSYYAHDLSAAELKSIEYLLTSHDLEVDLIYSSARDLDVLPRGIHKGSAAKLIAETMNVPPQRVIVCGDTGNDRAMFGQGFRGIVVGNAQPELAAVQCPATYHATAHYAAGVLEGISHWMSRA